MTRRDNKGSSWQHPLHPPPLHHPSSSPENLSLAWGTTNLNSAKRGWSQILVSPVCSPSCQFLSSQDPNKPQALLSPKISTHEAQTGDLCSKAKSFSLKGPAFTASALQMAGLIDLTLRQAYGSKQVYYRVELVTCGGCQALGALNSDLWVSRAHSWARAALNLLPAGPRDRPGRLECSGLLLARVPETTLVAMWGRGSRPAPEKHTVSIC